MIFETVVVGPLAVNCFILGCDETGEGVVIDPGADADVICSVVQRHSLKIIQILNTHGHFDHVGGNARVKAVTGAGLMIHEADRGYLGRAAMTAANYGITAENSPNPDQLLEDGMTIAFGRQQITVLHTPGHTPGGCCFHIKGENKLISGDTLFAESIGRTDLPGGSHALLISSIKSKLLGLPDETAVFPGHGPASTIGHEKRYNPYLNG
jgi:glyoxylase-like metal-dependent hydrolase (beta-lactamase superfamily II)